MNPARMVIDRDYTISRTDKNLFRSFVEPLGAVSMAACTNPAILQRRR